MAVEHSARQLSLRCRVATVNLPPEREIDESLFFIEAEDEVPKLE